MKFIITLCLSIMLSLPCFTQFIIEVDSTLILHNLDTVGSAEYLVVRDEDGILAKQNVEPIEYVELEKSLPYFPNYVDYGAGYENGIYYKENNRVFLGGLIRRINGPITNGDTICILPAAYQPFRRVLLHGFQDSQGIRINIESDGVVRVISNSPEASIDFISLDGMSFYRWAQIGDFIDGGYLFYIADPPADLDGDGILDKGLLAAPMDQGTAQWGCEGTATHATNHDVGAGKINTDIILSICTTQDIAADLCHDLVLNGHDDWYLPSKDELILMWRNLADSDGNGINDGVNHSSNIGNFSSVRYYSSTEWNLDSAFEIEMYLGGIYAFSKAPESRVRAIRTF